MKKLLLIALLSVSICFSQSNWEKGIGVSFQYNNSRKSFMPGIGCKLYYSPQFANFNKYEFALQFDVNINGMIYYNKISVNDSISNNWDLDIEQTQSFDIIYNRKIGSGKLLISIISLMHSEYEFFDSILKPHLFGRISYNYKLKKIAMELFFKRSKADNPNLGLLLTW